LRTTSVLIVTDDGEFARTLTACWQVERQLPGISVLTGDHWNEGADFAPDLLVIGPLKEGALAKTLRNLAHSTAIILCATAEAKELGLLRKRYPRLLHVPLREDWTQVVLLVAGESLRRTEGTARRAKLESGDLGPLHDGNEAQHEQRDDFAAGQCRAATPRARRTFRAISRADQDHSHHGTAYQRNHAAILIDCERNAGG